MWRMCGVGVFEATPGTFARVISMPSGLEVFVSTKYDDFFSNFDVYQWKEIRKLLPVFGMDVKLHMSLAHVNFKT